MNSGILILENDLVQTFSFKLSFEDVPGHTAIEGGYIWPESDESTWSVKLNAAVIDE